MVSIKVIIDLTIGVRIKVRIEVTLNLIPEP